jgi:hypothetical protein
MQFSFSAFFICNRAYYPEVGNENFYVIASRYLYSAEIRQNS